MTETANNENSTSVFFSVPLDTLKDLYTGKGTGRGPGLAAFAFGMGNFICAFLVSFAGNPIHPMPYGTSVILTFFILSLLQIGSSFFGIASNGRYAYAVQGISLTAGGGFMLALALWRLVMFLFGTASIDAFAVALMAVTWGTPQLLTGIRSFRNENRIITSRRRVTTLPADIVKSLKAEFKTLWHRKCLRPDVIPIEIVSPFSNVLKRILLGNDRMLVLPMIGDRIQSIAKPEWAPFLAAASASPRRLTRIDLPLEGRLRKCFLRSADLVRLQAWARTPRISTAP